MNIFGILLVSFALAADAFAISICKGLVLNKITLKECIKVGIWFGLFQMIMPIIGYILGSAFEKIIINIDHWISFSLLLYIGINMIIESFNNKDEHDNKIDFKTMLVLSIATSIDALSYGIAYAFGYGSKNAYLCFIMIGIITFITSFVGVKIGNKLGEKYRKLSQILGGIILILLGLKILLEHLNII